MTISGEKHISLSSNFQQPSTSFSNNMTNPNRKSLLNFNNCKSSFESSLQQPSTTNAPISSLSEENMNDSVPSSPKNSKSKRKLFTKKEDQLLTIAAIKYNQESWSKIAQSVPGKTPKQCRDRWVNYLQPPLNLGPWSDSEDKLLVSLVNKYGTHWTKMKTSFPSRSTNSIKNRWYWLYKNHIKIVSADGNYSNDQDPKNLNETLSNNISEKNYTELNQNNNYCQVYSNKINSDSFNSSDNFQQQKYYCLVKTKPKRKKYTKQPKRNNFNTLNNNNNQETNNFIQFNNNNFVEKDFQINLNDDIITFNQEELEW